MREGISTPVLIWLTIGALAIGCNDQSASPVGAGVPPGGVLEGGLDRIVVRDFGSAEDFEIFPARRAEGDRLVTALAWPEAQGFESRALFRFVVAESDSTLAVTELLGARLRFVYQPPDSPVTLAVYRVTAEWSEEAATWERRLFGAFWDAPGGDFVAEPVARFTVEPAAADSITLDSLRVDFPLDLAQAWRQDALENFGLVLVQETPGARVQFRSRGPSGLNADGPRLELDVRINVDENPIEQVSTLAREDTFIADRGTPPAEEGLLAAAGAPVSRVFLRPELDAVPPGATIVDAQLVLTVARALVPGDSLSLLAVPAASEFRGASTVFGSTSSAIGFASVGDTVQPGDTVVFSSLVLTRLARVWARSPESNRGLGIFVFDEEDEFGRIAFFGPDGSEGRRPRLSVLTLPPPGGEEGP